MIKTLTAAVMLLALAGIAPMLSACQTTAGVGKDVASGGKALSNAAERAAPAPAGDRR